MLLSQHIWANNYLSNTHHFSYFQQPRSMWLLLIELYAFTIVWKTNSKHFLWLLSIYQSFPIKRVFVYTGRYNCVKTSFHVIYGEIFMALGTKWRSSGGINMSNWNWATTANAATPHTFRIIHKINKNDILIFL